MSMYSRYQDMPDAAPPLDRSDARDARLVEWSRAACWAAAGAVATTVVYVAVDVEYAVVGPMPASTVASATIGVSIVFAAVLIATVLSYWMSRKEVREAERALAELDGVLTHAREQATRIAAHDRN